MVNVYLQDHLTDDLGLFTSMEMLDKSSSGRYDVHVKCVYCHILQLEYISRTGMVREKIQNMNDTGAARNVQR